MAADARPIAGNARLLAAGPWLVFVAALAVHRDNFARALLGWDSYATLVAARIGSGSDLVGTFSEKLMDGRLTFGDFYRPVGNFFVAFDVAVWGVDPFGHQLTSTVVFAAVCALVFIVVAQRQRTGEIAPAAWAATLVVLHPAALSILPVVARRTEILMIGFTLAALVAAGRRGVPIGQRRLWAGVFALLAVGSKEPGLVVLPLLALDRFLLEPAGADGATGNGVGARLRGALRFVWPATVAIACFAVLRTFVLGGLGGYFESPDSPYLVRLVAHAPAYLGMVEVTGALDAPGLGAVLAGIATASIVIGGVVLARARVPSAGLVLPVLGLAWIGFQLALASTAEKPEPRYVEGLVIGLALVLAGFVDASAALRHAATPSTGSARLLLGAAVLVSFTALSGSPLWREQVALAEASRTQAEELAVLEAGLRERPPGAYRENLRVRKLYGSEDRVVDHAWMLSPWGVQAWLELVFPDRTFEVDRNDLVRPEPTHWNLIVVELDEAPAD